MDLLVVELHEKFEKEHISAEDHSVVHSTVNAMGFTQLLASGSVEMKALRGCYVGSGHTSTSIQLMHAALQVRLGRRVGVMFAAGGEVHHFGLEAVETYGSLLGTFSGRGPTGYNPLPGFGADYTPKGGSLSSLFE